MRSSEKHGLLVLRTHHCLSLFIFNLSYQSIEWALNFGRLHSTLTHLPKLTGLLEIDVGRFSPCYRGKQIYFVLPGFVEKKIHKLLVMSKYLISTIQWHFDDSEFRRRRSWTFASEPDFCWRPISLITQTESFFGVFERLLRKSLRFVFGLKVLKRIVIKWQQSKSEAPTRIFKLGKTRHFPCIFLFLLFLSQAQTQSRTHTLTHKHTHPLSLSLFVFSLFVFISLSLSLSLSFFLFLSLSLSLSFFLFLCLFLSHCLSFSFLLCLLLLL